MRTVFLSIISVALAGCASSPAALPFQQFERCMLVTSSPTANQTEKLKVAQFCRDLLKFDSTPQ